MAFDLGIQAEKRQEGEKPDDENFKKFYLKELKEGDQITGTPIFGELKEKEVRPGKKAHEFYLIIKDPENKIKWVLGILCTVYQDDPNAPAIVYGAKDGRTYILIDSLDKVLNPDTYKPNKKGHRVAYEIFRQNLNDNLKSITARAVKPIHGNTTAPNIEIIAAELYPTE